MQYCDVDLAEIERQSFTRGDRALADMAAIAHDAESQRDAADLEAAEAVDNLAAVQRVLKTVIEAAERFVLDSEFTAEDIKILAGILDNAKDSI